jgi:hypothetical protein
MNWYSLENEVARRKDETRAIAAITLSQSALPQSPTPATHRRVLAALGAALITIGMRLQLEVDQMTETAPDLVEPLVFSRNGAGPGPC